MNVISKPKLFEAARRTKNPELASKVARWYEIATKNDFANFEEVKAVFPRVDQVKDRLVFNLGAYRLICGFSYLRRSFFFKELLTHAAYDRGGWKS